MQQDKFSQASMLVEEFHKDNISSSPSASSIDASDMQSVLNSTLNSPISLKRKDSQMYWKEKATNWKDKCESL